MQDKIRNIQLLRTFSILSVVAFHVYQMTYTGNHLLESTREQFSGIYFVPISCWLINVAMPLFMTISGYLFYWLLGKGKYTTWSDLIKKKALRLLVPYFVFGIIMMLTTGGYRRPLQIFGAYWHLWFLPTLMWCFIIGYLLRDLMMKRWISILILSVSFALVFAPKFLPAFMGLHIFPNWFYWFVLGGIMATNRDYLKHLFRKTKLHYVFFVLAVIIGILWPTEYGEEYNLLFTFGQTLLVMALWYITEFMDLKWMDRFPLINEIAWNSFGLYIFHNWIALYLIGNFAKRTMGIEEFAPAHPYLYPFLFFSGTLLISFCLSYGLRKTKVGRFLLG